MFACRHNDKVYEQALLGTPSSATGSSRAFGSSKTEQWSPQLYGLESIPLAPRYGSSPG
jgi:hypothetical protein